MSLNEEQRAQADKLIQECINDPKFLDEVEKKIEQATDTVMGMMASGITMEDAIEILEAAVTNSVIEDHGK